MRVAILLALVFLASDFFRSALFIRGKLQAFYRNYKPKPELASVGKGPEFHIVLLSDSTIDGHTGNKLMFGPAEGLVEYFAKTYKVSVHLYAKESAFSYDIVAKQLPKAEALAQIDLIFVYMGANNAMRLGSPWRVKRDFETVLDFAARRGVPVVASQLANYWQYTFFSLLHRGLIYLDVNLCNYFIRSCTQKYAKFVAVDIKQLAKACNTPEYYVDGFHPSDKANRLWSDTIMVEARKNPATKDLFA